MFEDETDQGKSVSFDDDMGSLSSEEEDNSRVGRVCTEETSIIKLRDHLGSTCSTTIML